MPFAGYQHPVQALSAATGDPPFGDRVRPRCLHRCFDDPHADGGEYGVEGRGELGVPVADQELQAASLVFEVYQEVAGLLDHPCTCGVSRDPGKVHAAGAVLDEEQHVQPV